MMCSSVTLGFIKNFGRVKQSYCLKYQIACSLEENRVKMSYKDAVYWLQLSTNVSTNK